MWQLLNREDWLERLGITADQVPRIVLLCGSEGRQEWERRYSEAFDRVVKLPRRGLDGLLIGQLEGISVGLGCVYGAGQAAEAVHIFGMLGTAAIFQIGDCWSLLERVKPGDLFVAVEAYRAEGVSNYYQPGGMIIEAAYNGLELSVLQKTSGSKVHWGRIYTTSARYAQVNSQVNCCITQSCWAADMHTAAVYAAARYFGMDCVALLAVQESNCREKKNSNRDQSCRHNFPDNTNILQFSLEAARQYGCRLDQGRRKRLIPKINCLVDKINQAQVAKVC